MIPVIDGWPRPAEKANIDELEAELKKIQASRKERP
jgi:hypothetical protein